MDYKQASEQLQGRNKDRRKLENNTYLERRADGSIAVRLHDTDVVTLYPDGRTVLNSGGWRTPTTKDRINKYVSVRIGQENGIWYVYGHDANGAFDWDHRTVYEDGITVNADGTISGGHPDNTKELLKLRRKVQRFAKNYMEAFQRGEVPPPSAGDCLYCVMREVGTNKPVGEVFSDKDHILSHIEEPYYVPSLLARAFETMPHSVAMGWALASQWRDRPEANDSKQDTFERITGNIPEFCFDQLRKILGRYILRQLGQAA